MAQTMHTMSAPLFIRMLENMAAWLDKAQDHADRRGFDSDNYLALRLAPDMLPFSRQVQIASDSVKSCFARLAGEEPPKWPDDEKSLAELRARIERTLDYARAVDPAKITDTEDREIVMPAGPERTIKLSGENFLKGYAIPNFYFHATMTYALLRQAGVALGKMDYLGEIPR